MQILNPLLKQRVLEKFSYLTRYRKSWQKNWLEKFDCAIFCTRHLTKLGQRWQGMGRGKAHLPVTYLFVSVISRPKLKGQCHEFLIAPKKKIVSLNLPICMGHWLTCWSILEYGFDFVEILNRKFEFVTLFKFWFSHQCSPIQFELTDFHFQSYQRSWQKTALTPRSHT